MSGMSGAHQPGEPNLCPPATWPPLHWSPTAEGAPTSVIIISTQGGKCPLPPNQLGATLSWSFSDSSLEYVCPQVWCVFVCRIYECLGLSLGPDILWRLSVSICQCMWTFVSTMSCDVTSRGLMHLSNLQSCRNY